MTLPLLQSLWPSSAAIKYVVCRAILGLPSKYWEPVSAIVRRIWPGVRGA
jgi:hypothetical protein